MRSQMFITANSNLFGRLWSHKDMFYHAVLKTHQSTIATQNHCNALQPKIIVTCTYIVLTVPDSFCILTQVFSHLVTTQCRVPNVYVLKVKASDKIHATSFEIQISKSCSKYKY